MVPNELSQPESEAGAAQGRPASEPRRAGRLARELGLGLAALVLLLAALSLLVIQSGARGALLAEAQQALVGRAELLAASLAAALPLDALDEDLFERLELEDRGLQLAWVDATGQPCYRSRDLPDWALELAAGEATTRRTLGSDTTWLACGVALTASGAPAGRLALARPATGLEARLDDLRARALIGSGLAALLALLAGYLLVRRRLEPLDGVTRFVADVGAGRSGFRLPPGRDDEVGVLVRAVERMADDIGERDRAVRRELAQQRAILTSMADGVLAVDAEQRVVLVNRSARELLPFTVKRPEGAMLLDVLRQTEVLELIATCIGEGRRQRRRLLLPPSLASAPRTLELLASPLVDEHGGGCVLVIENRTEIEHLERVRRDFVANVSHELKTPLTSVRGYLETIRDDDAMETGLRDRFLDRALVNTERLAAIVGDLLTLARAEAGEGPDREAVDLFELARDSAFHATALATESAIALEVRGQRGEALVTGDRSALASALGNLVENAIKYSPPDTRVTISVGATDGWATVSVEDQGAGISEEHQERIFERFYRIDKDRSRSLGGTGLGLSIVRHVALSHGGQAGLASELGKGSRFWIALPAIELG